VRDFPFLNKVWTVTVFFSSFLNWFLSASHFEIFGHELFFFAEKIVPRTGAGMKVEKIAQHRTYPVSAIAHILNLN
jgi:hypothetical protein